MRYKIKPEELQPLVSRYFYQLYKACGSPLGMGALQDLFQKPESQETETEEQTRIFQNVTGSGDYSISRNQPDRLYGDYVAGRMMKAGIRHGTENGQWVEVSNESARSDYQSWARKFKTEDEVLRFVADELNIVLENI